MAEEQREQIGEEQRERINDAVVECIIKRYTREETLIYIKDKLGERINRLRKALGRYLCQDCALQKINRMVTLWFQHLTTNHHSL